jgi:cytochrome P450
VAGSNTSACTIVSVLFYLADNPSAYVRAVEEVRSKASSRVNITAVNLSTCVYLWACIDKALRMSLAVGSALVREVVSATSTTVDGQLIPPRMEVGSRTYAVHYNV